MPNLSEMNGQQMEFLVWLIEKSARAFFEGDKCAAYAAFKDSKLLDFYVEHYDVSHTLGAECLLDEIRDWLKK